MDGVKVAQALGRVWAARDMRHAVGETSELLEDAIILAEAIREIAGIDAGLIQAVPADTSTKH